ncbi:MAG: heavy-metal-associated domain-containing protein [Arcobacteraceae bacterium]
MKIIIALSLSFMWSFAQTMSVIKVEGMHCPLCTTAVKKAIKPLEGIEKSSAILNTKTVTVIYDENKVTLEAILNAIKTTSYEGIEISTKQLNP